MVRKWKSGNEERMVVLCLEVENSSESGVDAGSGEGLC